MLALSPTTGALAAALAKAQAEMHHASKDAKNPHFRSTYATLAAVIDAVRPALAKHGIAVVQAPSAEGKAVSLHTTLLHASGECVTTAITAEARDATPQSIGSAITYLRRYALQSIAGIASEDDDGEAAQGRRPAAASEPSPAGADLAALRLSIAALDLDHAAVEAYCATIKRPFASLTSESAAKLLAALQPGTPFRADFDKWMDK